MQVSSVVKQVFSNVNKMDLKNEKSIALSFKDPRDRGRVLTLDVDKTSFEDLLKSFSKSNFAIKPDGSVDVKGDAGKKVASWWESIAYRKRYESGADKLNIKAHRVVEDPYIKENYVNLGLINKSLSKLDKILREDGKSLKTSWISGDRLNLVKSQEYFQSKVEKLDINSSLDRVPTEAILYFKSI